MSVFAKDYGYFFNSNNHDRTYNADSFEEWLRPFFVSGVFNGDLQVSAQDTPDMTVNVASGHANLNGKPALWPDANTLQLATASGVYDRIDTIVLRRDNTNRTISLEVVTGVASSTPQPTAPTRDSDIFELVIAQILVGVGVTEITNANITDTRMDSDLCGWVAATVDQIDFAQISQQFVGWEDEMQGYFTAWFDSIKGQLDEDAAGHLQNEIDHLDGIVVKSINGEKPIDGGLAFVRKVTLAEDLASDENQAFPGMFTVRRSPVNTETPAVIHSILGNRIHVPNASRGTIYQVKLVSGTTKYVSTGKNLLKNGTARLPRGNGTYYKIVGDYTSLSFYDTFGEYVCEITPNFGKFSVPKDGRLVVTGYNSSNTAVFFEYAGPPYTFEAYESSEISLYSLSSRFPYGGMNRVGGVYDEINFDQQKTYNRIGRLIYSEENLSTVQATGQDYECDDDYIYYVLETPYIENINIDGHFTSYQYGVEGLNFGNEDCVAPFFDITYGISPRKKWDATTDGLAIIIKNDVASVDVAVGDYVLVVDSTITGVTDGLYTANAVVTAGTSFVAANLTSVTNGGLNALSSNIAPIKKFSLVANTAKSFTIASGSRIQVLLYGAANASCGDIELMTTGGGSVNLNKNGASNVSYSVASNKITLTSTANVEVICLVYSGNISEST